eukprot:7775224-Pyramimonas_sp.AAC.1
MGPRALKSRTERYAKFTFRRSRLKQIKARPQQRARLVQINLKPCLAYGGEVVALSDRQVRLLRGAAAKD